MAAQYNKPMAVSATPSWGGVKHHNFGKNVASVQVRQGTGGPMGQFSFSPTKRKVFGRRKKPNQVAFASRSAGISSASNQSSQVGNSFQDNFILGQAGKSGGHAGRGR